MSIDELAEVSDIFNASPTDKILIVGWYIHTVKGADRFDNAGLRDVMRSIHVEPPDVSVYLPRMAERKPAQVVKVRGGYRLDGAVRRAFDEKYSDHPTTISVKRTLLELPQRIPDAAERAFLLEAIACYRAGAFRATNVMVWNLTFDHLRTWIFSEPGRLAQFNDGLTSKYPKKTRITSLAEFDELKEFEFVEALRTGRLLTKNVCDILREKLGRRNMSAHPSSVVITQHQADDMITDLVNNVILPLT